MHTHLYKSEYIIWIYKKHDQNQLFLEQRSHCNDSHTQKRKKKKNNEILCK